MERRLVVNAMGVLGGLALSFLFGAAAYADGPENTATSTPDAVVEETATSIPEQVQLKVEGYTLVSTEPDLCEEKAYFCNVPAPTVIKPSGGLVYPYGNEVLITGLSWNQTKVDLYIDGVYEGRVHMREHPSGIGNFWYRPSRAIRAGSHTLYTIALSLNEWDRSQRSLTTPFTVQQTLKPAPKPQPVPQPTPKPAEQPAEPETKESTTSAPVTSRILGFFFGGTTTATSTAAIMTVNTVVGLVILILILLFIMRLARGHGRVDTGAPHDQHLPFDESPPPDTS